jgi:hypothetical protein
VDTSLESQNNGGDHQLLLKDSSESLFWNCERLNIKEKNEFTSLSPLSDRFRKKEGTKRKREVELETINLRQKRISSSVPNDLRTESKSENGIHWISTAGQR